MLPGPGHWRHTWTELTTIKTERRPLVSRYSCSHGFETLHSTNKTHLEAEQANQPCSLAWVNSSVFLMWTNERWDRSLAVTQEWCSQSLSLLSLPQTLWSPESDCGCRAGKEQPVPREQPSPLLPLPTALFHGLLFDCSFLNHLISACYKMQHLKNME